MIPQLRIKLNKEKNKAKEMRELEKLIDNKNSYKLSLQKIEQEKKVEFFNNMLQHMERNNYDK